jgi:hypothetical protein
MTIHNSANQNDADNGVNTLRVGIEQPGFFPYARFPLSSSRREKAAAEPLSLNREPTVWPALMDSKTVKSMSAVNRKKHKT